MRVIAYVQRLPERIVLQKERTKQRSTSTASIVVTEEIEKERVKENKRFTNCVAMKNELKKWIYRENICGTRLYSMREREYRPFDTRTQNERSTCLLVMLVYILQGRQNSVLLLMVSFLSFSLSFWYSVCRSHSHNRAGIILCTDLCDCIQ